LTTASVEPNVAIDCTSSEVEAAEAGAIVDAAAKVNVPPALDAAPAAMLRDAAHAMARGLPQHEGQSMPLL
jgi:hypothetical protein